ncbi:hypothetical protein CHLRE_16g653750v5 [Chlamydomonas reinhardtii]|uniref:Uncharacterized protein n=1 Tax=Chlamydomonas reinhardtii TaxID=3055 RepID=A0A2K3CT16_CHLRE|nr:uncharacterized protein CHLRE_16g653750v5 [Chlamydomonas reinhardtii]PNW71424.1 hypothetical protein CHLRE_16g653750v5 [Chlamydomonas reinhardtii]
MTRLQRTPVTGAAAARRTLRLLAVACILVAVAVKAGRVISDGGAGPSTADTAAAPTTATATPAPKSTGSVLKAIAGPSAGATAAARGLKQWMPWSNFDTDKLPALLQAVQSRGKAQASAAVPQPAVPVAPLAQAAPFDIPAATASVSASSTAASAPHDDVALAAAKALGTASGGINVVSTSPLSLSNPIDIIGGNYNQRANAAGAAGH